MTREEVAEIINYCQTNQVTYKARLQELGIPTWKFYDAKAKYAKEEVSENAQGAFQQLRSGDIFVPMPSFAAKPRQKSRSKRQADEPRSLSVELRAPNGTMMRISGEMATRVLQSIILASCGYVQPERQHEVLAVQSAYGHAQELLYPQWNSEQHNGA